METKLPSILRRIPWSLALKSLAAGLAWYALPLWAALLAAVYFYFAPLFEARKFAFPFLVLLFLMWAEPVSFLMALVLAGVFFLLLGIKDLVFIDRSSAYEILVMLLEALIVVRFAGRIGAAAWVSAPALACVLFLLLLGFLSHEQAAVPSEAARSRRLRRAVMAGAGALLFGEYLTVLSFLPLWAPYASIAAMFFLFLLAETLSASVRGKFEYGAAFFNAALVVGATALLLGGVGWKI